MKVKTDTQVISKRRSFKYLRSIFEYGEIVDDVTYHIGAGWVKLGLHLVSCVIRMCHQDLKVVL